MLLSIVLFLLLQNDTSAYFIKLSRAVLRPRGLTDRSTCRKHCRYVFGAKIHDSFPIAVDEEILGSRSEFRCLEYLIHSVYDHVVLNVA